MSSESADRFLRGLLPGLAWDAGSRYPAAALELLPADAAAGAAVPAGVHLALAGTAAAVNVGLRHGAACALASPASRDEFTAVAEDAVARTAIPAGDGWVTVALPRREPGKTVRVYLPEREQVFLDRLTPVGGTVESAGSTGPLWVAYGDSITHGWSVTSPHLSWPARVAERLGLHLVNLGLAGGARGELPAATTVAESGADLVTIAWGTNAWSKVPTDRRHIAETMRLFLTAVRQGLSNVPIVVISPIVRLGAESAPNRFGDTLADLRAAIESAASDFIRAHGDSRMTVVPGLELLDADAIVDGVHPGDLGHGLMADALVPILRRTAIPGEES